ncbi:hypothetical protein M8R50_16805 [Enterobacter bugandensis]|uniref:hypothetical protein n=1 Tax=Enterobacter bugandensis TaxID=881260 RepID=UPI0020759112|nr:hypothetical protein [Enterobacter bugandensis]MCM7239198.1 hypothetical protein [Enterobacter bugandensis]MCM7319104.1 hypothetical protein [Enterobacter bugandensis]MCM7354569.1 hypothetical protein [Enterobacter bugandensis]
MDELSIALKKTKALKRLCCGIICVALKFSENISAAGDIFYLLPDVNNGILMMKACAFALCLPARRVFSISLVWLNIILQTIFPLAVTFSRQ